MGVFIRFLFIMSFGIMFPMYLFGQPYEYDELKSEHEKLVRIVNVVSDRELLKDKKKFLRGLIDYDEKEIDRGFGCKYVHIRLNCDEIFVVSFGNQILEYVINFDCNLREDHAGMVAYIIEKDTALKRKVSLLGYTKKNFSISYVNETVSARFRKKVSDSLGAAIVSGMSIDTGIEYKRYYGILMNPIYYYPYGMLCGSGQEKPKGRIAIEYFKGINDFNKIRTILKGYNPEGRIYAIEALLLAAKNRLIILSNDDVRSIRAVIDLKLPIDFCENCIGEQKLAADLISEEQMSLLN